MRRNPPPKKRMDASGRVKKQKEAYIHNSQVRTQKCVGAAALHIICREKGFPRTLNEFAVECFQAESMEAVKNGEQWINKWVRRLGGGGMGRIRSSALVARAVKAAIVTSTPIGFRHSAPPPASASPATEPAKKRAKLANEPVEPVKVKVKSEEVEANPNMPSPGLNLHIHANPSPSSQAEKGDDASIQLSAPSLSPAYASAYGPYSGNGSPSLWWGEGSPTLSEDRERKMRIEELVSKTRWLCEELDPTPIVIPALPGSNQVDLVISDNRIRSANATSHGIELAQETFAAVLEMMSPVLAACTLAVMICLSAQHPLDLDMLCMNNKSQFSIPDICKTYKLLVPHVNTILKALSKREDRERRQARKRGEQWAVDGLSQPPDRAMYANVTAGYGPIFWGQNLAHLTNLSSNSNGSSPPLKDNQSLKLGPSSTGRGALSHNNVQALVSRVEGNRTITESGKSTVKDSFMRKIEAQGSKLAALQALPASQIMASPADTDSDSFSWPIKDMAGGLVGKVKVGIAAGAGGSGRIAACPAYDKGGNEEEEEEEEEIETDDGVASVKARKKQLRQEKKEKKKEEERQKLYEKLQSQPTAFSGKILVVRSLPRELEPVLFNGTKLNRLLPPTDKQKDKDKDKDKVRAKPSPAASERGMVGTDSAASLTSLANSLASSSSDVLESEGREKEREREREKGELVRLQQWRNVRAKRSYESFSSPIFLPRKKGTPFFTLGSIPEACEAEDEEEE